MRFIYVWLRRPIIFSRVSCFKSYVLGITKTEFKNINLFLLSLNEHRTSCHCSSSVGIQPKPPWGSLMIKKAAFKLPQADDSLSSAPRGTCLLSACADPTGFPWDYGNSGLHISLITRDPLPLGRGVSPTRERMSFCFCPVCLPFPCFWRLSLQTHQESALTQAEGRSAAPHPPLGWA